MTRLVKFLFLLSLLLTILPGSAFASGTTTEVSTPQQFLDALNDPAVGTIRLQQNIMLPQLTADTSLVIPQHNSDLTIIGSSHTLTVNHGGIVLGGNTAFKDVVLDMTNFVRNAIFANGYTLTLDGLKNGSSAKRVHLFCGGILDYNSGPPALPASGPLGTINLQGENETGDIFAGSLADTGKPYLSNLAADITIAQTTGNSTPIHVYACGASEVRGAGDGDAWTVLPAQYQVSGAVNVHLNSAGDNQLPCVAHVHGIASTQKQNAASVSINSLSDYSYSPILESVSSISVKQGSVSPKEGSSLANIPETGLGVSPNAKLDLNTLNDKISVETFSGGGTLIVKQKQSITVSGQVTGRTSVAIDGLNYDGSESQSLPLKNHAYLIAPKSDSSSFSLICHSFDDTPFTKDGQGRWSVGELPKEISLLSFELGTPEVNPSGSEILIPIDASFSPGSDEDLQYLPYSIVSEGVQTSATADSKNNGYYSCSATQNYYNLLFSIHYYDSDGMDVPYLQIIPTNAAVIPPKKLFSFELKLEKAYIAGASGTTTYPISFTVPDPDAVPPSPPQETGITIESLAYLNGGQYKPIENHQQLPKSKLQLEIKLACKNISESITTQAIIAAYASNRQMVGVLTVSQLISPQDSIVMLKPEGHFDNTTGRIADLRVFLVNDLHSPITPPKQLTIQ